MRYDHTFDPAAMEVLIGMDERAIRTAVETLIGRHATELPKFIAAPWDDYDLIFNADSTATVVLRLWVEIRHAVVQIVLMFEKGIVVDIDGVSRKSFGA